MTSSTNQAAAAQAVIDAAVALGYPAPDLATMETIYDDCGYAVTIPSTDPMPFLADFETGDTSQWSAVQD